MAVFLLSAVSVAASIRVTPMRLAIVAEPGGQAGTTQIQVANTSHRAQTVTFSARDFLVDDAGKALFEPRDEPGLDATTMARFGAAGYTDTDPHILELAPGAEETVVVRVELPDEARDEYHTMLVAATRDADPAPAVGTRVAVEIGVLVLVTAGTEIHDEDGELRIERSTRAVSALRISDFRVEAPSPDSARQTVRLHGRVHNVGTTRATLWATAVRVDLGENVMVDRVVVRNGGSLLLPGASRRFHGDMEYALEPGRYMIRIDMDGGAPGLWATKAAEIELHEPLPGLGSTKQWTAVAYEHREAVLTLDQGAADGVFEMLVYNLWHEDLDVIARVEGDVGGIEILTPRLTIASGRSQLLRVRGVRPADHDVTRSLHTIRLHPELLDGRPLPRDVPLTIRLTVDATAR